ncbi:AbrB family transcriptional regulator [Bifidobacterium scardovii]|uniref:AbrB family transcriptional regulator n=1 Tax=Bifidobacterium scardovii TaxID=158787 RepID=A0A087DJY2_9BIFI|nr:AbrB family transcriptional regulator [Bifidobacterium scardovii]KFI95832.1 AbrB family transcriptional regulator [Bifidobacterium scardovii]MBS6948436.1 AbrB family transcriptional regulator [Bifidobacterium scardovii]MDK6349419.1 AbrB family transcriptional regulator [Bifidobacterium scardovii]MDU2421318.1 AbrB family transcriptional regulator [Bifidobacterium scardovii]MDU3737187.1 AbrB family transcriptional regulator [Bifidobacterium scardovii]
MSESIESTEPVEPTAVEPSAASGASGAESNASPEPYQPDQSAQAFEPLTATYERLRHSTDPDELSEFARRPLPDKADQAAFSRATALLEAVAGNANTPVEDRIMLAQTMPFPNVLVKLSVDDDQRVRAAVAANTDDKNWLVGRLTKDAVPEVRDIALRNKRTSWKMRLEGAQNEQLDPQTLDFLSHLGVDSEPDASPILSAMVRRAVALNPNTDAETLGRLASDPDPVVAKEASRRV